MLSLALLWLTYSEVIDRGYDLGSCSGLLGTRDARTMLHASFGGVIGLLVSDLDAEQ